MKLALIITAIILCIGTSIAKSLCPRGAFFADPPHLVVMHDGQADRPAVVELDAGDTFLDVGKSTSVVLQNGGESPLEIRLAYVSCGCLRDVTIDGSALKLAVRRQDSLTMPR